MKNFIFLCLAVFSMTIQAGAETEQATVADLILYNGKVITVDKDFSMAEALAVLDGKIYAVGSNKEIVSLAGDRTKLIDLRGKSLIPGIVDSHVHPYGMGESLLADVQMRDVNSLQQMLDRISAAAARKKPGQWIVAASTWHYLKLGGRPTLAQLDKAAPDNPLWIPMGGHEGFTNSRGMKLANIHKDLPDPDGGVIIRDEKTGLPTGQLRDEAMTLVKRLLPPIDSIKSLKSAMDFYKSLGVTAVGIDGLGFYESSYEAYQTLNARDELTMRVTGNLFFHPGLSDDYINGVISTIAYAGLERGGLGNNMFRIVGLKTHNEDTASGKPSWPAGRLTEVLLSAARHKIRMAVHSVCAATAETLTIMQEVNKQYPIHDLRWGILHQECATKETIAVNKELDLVINHEMGMIFMSIGPEVFHDGFGGAGRKPGVMYAPIPLYLKQGIPFSLNSDGGGSNRYPSIWVSVFVATNRDHWPKFGGEYSISRQEALRAITMGGAYKTGMETKVGSIEPGKLADLVVLSDDPLTCSNDELIKITSELTVLGGRVIHDTGTVTH